MVGLIDSVYLSWVKLSHNEALCLPGIGNCETVNTSRYSEILGIPVALMGAGAYLLILGVFLYNEKKADSKNHALFQNILFGTTLAGMLFSFYLTYLEIAVIKAICPFCIISAICITFLFILTILINLDSFKK